MFARKRSPFNSRTALLLGIVLVGCQGGPSQSPRTYDGGPDDTTDRPDAGAHDTATADGPHDSGGTSPHDAEAPGVDASGAHTDAAIPDAGPADREADPDTSPPACTRGGSGFDTTVDGMALDRPTCLAWQRLDPPKPFGACLIPRDNDAKLCWEEAGRYCQNLQLGGGGWRLPTRAELATIVVPASYPAIDKTVFPEALISLYWTAEQSGAKIVCLDFGNAGAVNEHIGPDGPQAVRCVRGPLP